MFFILAWLREAVGFAVGPRAVLYTILVLLSPLGGLEPFLGWPLEAYGKGKLVLILGS